MNSPTRTLLRARKAGIKVRFFLADELASQIQKEIDREIINDLLNAVRS